MKLTCCVTIKNRCLLAYQGTDGRPASKLLFPRCIDSFLESASGLPVRLVVADFASTDMPLAGWLPERAAAAGVDLRILSIDDPFFCKGRGLNLAAAAHRDVEHLMFFDTEMLFPRQFFIEGLAAADAGSAYFPICQYETSQDGRAFIWSNGGKGNCVLPRNVYARAHGFPEYTKWGYEDTHFHVAVAGLCPIVRAPLRGFRHMWHPTTPAYRDKYYLSRGQRVNQRPGVRT